MNSKGHLILSVIKSCIRLFGCALAVGARNWIYLAVMLGIAELLGVAEELVDKR